MKKNAMEAKLVSLNRKLPGDYERHKSLEMRKNYEILPRKYMILGGDFSRFFHFFVHRLIFQFEISKFFKNYQNSKNVSNALYVH